MVGILAASELSAIAVHTGAVGHGVNEPVEYKLKSHRHADVIIANDAPSEWAELVATVRSISDADIIERFESSARAAKSISESINSLLKIRLTASGWMPEAPIFQDSEYQDKRWRLDFAKGMLSVEVAFNHGEAIAWNLLKPVLASEYNHVQKAIQTRFGVIICATEEMKIAGGFDSSVGTFEKFERYLVPLQNPLTVPIMLLGLQAPRTFVVEHEARGNGRTGKIRRL